MFFLIFGRHDEFIYLLINENVYTRNQYIVLMNLHF